ncbi:MAG: hypothetical protein E7479_01700 [Ruminococcaceae bacterium]|nr:hypothetical protein [Oscillospiraceae bacterium]
MRKIICFALVLTMLFSACSGKPAQPEIFENEQLSEESSEPEEIPEEIPEEPTEPEEFPEKLSGTGFEFEKPEILYPENVPEELFESAAFAEAMNRPSVILYDYEPISDCLAAVNFVEAAEKGEYAELYVFRFTNIEYYETKDASCVCFISDNGKTECEYEYWIDWETKEPGSSKKEIEKIYINDFGYLTAESEIYDTVYYKIISDFELYENAAENLEFKEKYIDPIFTITVSPEEFDSPSCFSGTTLLWLFEDIYNFENGQNPWQEFGNNWPVSEMLLLLNQYFDGVTKEMLLSDTNAEYDQKTDTLYYEGGRGGVAPEIRVVDHEQKGDILILYYHLYDGESGTIYSAENYVLEIRLFDNGSFRYLSQKIISAEK